MNDRRDFLQLAAILAMAGPAAANAHDATPTRGRGEIARYPLEGELAGKEAVLVDLVAQPGRMDSTNAHRHPGFVLGYVIEGEYAFAINDDETRIIKAGETFYEPAGALHYGKGSASDKPAHLLAFMVVPAGATLATPA